MKLNSLNLVIVNNMSNYRLCGWASICTAPPLSKPLCTSWISGNLHKKFEDLIAKVKLGNTELPVRL